MLSSIKNPRIKNIQALLTRPKERKKQKAYVVEGEKMVNEIPKELLVDLYISEDYPLDSHKFPHSSYEIVKKSVFKQISDTKNPQGILAVVKQKEVTFSQLFQVKNPLLLVLEDIQDPGNLGTMIRSAEGAGVTAVILSKNCVDRFNPKVIRSTMGAIFRVPCLVLEEPFEVGLERLKGQGINLVAAHLDGKLSYDQGNYTQGTAFLIGNESKGLKIETARKCQTWVKIPMLGSVESLNAAVAASLLMFEGARQRRKQQ